VDVDVGPSSVVLLLLWSDVVLGSEVVPLLLVVCPGDVVVPEEVCDVVSVSGGVLVPEVEWDEAVVVVELDLGVEVVFVGVEVGGGGGGGVDVCDGVVFGGDTVLGGLPPPPLDVK